MKSGVLTACPFVRLAGLFLLAISTGCTSTYGGSSLGYPYRPDEEVVYFSPGPEFKLASEDADMQAEVVAAQENAAGEASDEEPNVQTSSAALDTEYRV